MSEQQAFPHLTPTSPGKESAKRHRYTTGMGGSRAAIVGSLTGITEFIKELDDGLHQPS